MSDTLEGQSNFNEKDIVGECPFHNFYKSFEIIWTAETVQSK